MELSIDIGRCTPIEWAFFLRRLEGMIESAALRNRPNPFTGQAIDATRRIILPPTLCEAALSHPDDFLSERN